MSSLLNTLFEFKVTNILPCIYNSLGFYQLIQVNIGATKEAMGDIVPPPSPEKNLSIKKKS